MHIEDVVVKLIDQQSKIFEILDFDERPIRRPPASPEQLALLDAWCRSRDFVLPATYRDFLLICDGIENFSLSYSLFGSVEFLSDTYPRLLTEIFSDSVGFACRDDRPPILLGSDPETTTRLWLDLAHEVIADDEPVVLDGEPGDMTLHASFGAFLLSRIDSNELTIKRLLQLRARSFKD